MTVWNAADFEPELAEMGALKHGWLNSYGTDGEAITEASVVTMRAILASLCAAGVAKPYVYPTHDGGLQCEWNEIFGEVKACANGMVEAWADLEPEALPRDETIWEAKGPAATLGAIVTAFAVVARMIPPAKDAHGALVREVKQHPVVARGDDGDDVGRF